MASLMGDVPAEVQAAEPLPELPVEVPVGDGLLFSGVAHPGGEQRDPGAFPGRGMAAVQRVRGTDLLPERLVVLAGDRPQRVRHPVRADPLHHSQQQHGRQHAPAGFTDRPHPVGDLNPYAGPSGTGILPVPSW